MDKRLHEAYFIEHRVRWWLVILALLGLGGVGWQLWR